MKETSYCEKSFWFSYILFIIIIGGILVLFIYIRRLASNEIFSPSNKIHGEVGRAKDLSSPRYTNWTQLHPPPPRTIIKPHVHHPGTSTSDPALLYPYYKPFMKCQWHWHTTFCLASPNTCYCYRLRTDVTRRLQEGVLCYQNATHFRGTHDKLV